MAKRKGCCSHRRCRGGREPLVLGLGWAQAPQRRMGCIGMSLKGTRRARPSSEDIIYSTRPLGGALEGGSWFSRERWGASNRTLNLSGPQFPYLGKRDHYSTYPF